MINTGMTATVTRAGATVRLINLSPGPNPRFLGDFKHGHGTRDSQISPA